MEPVDVAKESPVIMIMGNVNMSGFDVVEAKCLDLTFTLTSHERMNPFNNLRTNHM